MQREIDDRLANLLLAGDLSEGSQVVVDVDGSEDHLTVSVTSE